ncbi:MAG: DUF552 domain-containing protein [Methanosphaera stadtmanae]|nr:DUF552 domain-containing protein [Methanosphaera stadtmanae]
MKNTFKDFTVNVKKSIDREYDGESNMEPDYDESQKAVNDNVISSIEQSYDDDYEEYDIVIDNPEDDISLIEPDSSNIDMIRLIKVRTINELSEELENVNKTGVPAIIDLKYIQERRVSEFKKVGSTLKAFKSATNANVVLLGSTRNVIVVTPEDIRILKE